MGFLERVLSGRRHDLQRRERVETPAEPTPPARPAPRTDLTQLLGRSLVEPYAREVCREFRLAPVLGAGRVRALRSPEMGVEVGTDDYGTVTTIVLHFHGDGGFGPYPGAIPGRGGTIAKRGSLWAALGRPDFSTDPDRHEQQGASDQWRFPTFLMHAQYAMDGENLLRLTLGR